MNGDTSLMETTPGPDKIRECVAQWQLLQAIPLAKQGPVRAAMEFTSEDEQVARTELERQAQVRKHRSEGLVDFPPDWERHDDILCFLRLTQDGNPLSANDRYHLPRMRERVLEVYRQAGLNEANVPPLHPGMEPFHGREIVKSRLPCIRPIPGASVPTQPAKEKRFTSELAAAEWMYGSEVTAGQYRTIQKHVPTLHRVIIEMAKGVRLQHMLEGAETILQGGERIVDKSSGDVPADESHEADIARHGSKSKIQASGDQAASSPDRDSPNNKRVYSSPPQENGHSGRYWQHDRPVVKRKRIGYDEDVVNERV